MNGSSEELGNNHAADECLLSDPGAFLDALAGIGRSWPDWFDLQKSVAMNGCAVGRSMSQPSRRATRPKGAPCTRSSSASMSRRRWATGIGWVFDGGNTHFWSEIAVNMAGWRGRKLGGILHPGNYSLLGVGVSFGIAAKATHPESNVVVISGDGAFLSGGLSVEAAFQEGLPITVVVDSNGG